MKNRLNSLSPRFLAAWYRNQGTEVRDNVRRALGIFFPTQPTSSNTLSEIVKEKKETEINTSEVRNLNVMNMDLMMNLTKPTKNG